LVGDDIALLRRRPEPTIGEVLRKPAVKSGTYEVGEEIALPATPTALWARLEIKPNLLGMIVALAYKLPQLQIEFHMADGSVNQFRYIEGMGETGFVVSPLVQTTTDFLALEHPSRAAYFAESRPQSISISVVGGTVARSLWSGRLSMQLFEMDIPVQQRVNALFTQSFDAETIDPEAARLPETNDCWIDHINNRLADGPLNSIKGLLRVDGWAAVSMKDGATPDQTKIILTGKNGDVHSLVAKITPRDDVNKYFKNPNIGNVGFVAFADISALSGDYTLGIQVSAHGETRNCAKRKPLSIVAVEPDKG
jgi:hypothetical protein